MCIEGRQAGRLCIIIEGGQGQTYISLQLMSTDRRWGSCPLFMATHRLFAVSLPRRLWLRSTVWQLLAAMMRPWTRALPALSLWKVERKKESKEEKC